MVGGAASLAQFRPRLRRRARGAGLSRHPRRRRPRHRRHADQAQARRRLQRAARPFGEDGTIQGLLEILRIPYTHSGVLASALAVREGPRQDGDEGGGHSGRRTASSSIATKPRARHALEPPYVLKPVNEGSSLGVVIVHAGRSHPPQEVGRDDWPYGDRLLAEKFVAGKELTCAVMGDRVSRHHRNSAGFRSLSTATTRNTRRAAPSTSFRRNLNRIFTMKFKT